MKEQKTYVSSHAESTDPFTSARITISYSGSTTSQQPRSWKKIYVRVGRLVVSASRCPEANLHRTLRNMLTALNIYPAYLNFELRHRSTATRSTLESNFLKVRMKPYQKMSLQGLLNETYASMALIQSSLCGGHLRLGTSPNVKVFLDKIDNSIACLIFLMNKSEFGAEKLRRLSKQGLSEITWDSVDSTIKSTSRTKSSNFSEKRKKNTKKKSKSSMVKRKK